MFILLGIILLFLTLMSVALKDVYKFRLCFLLLLTLKSDTLKDTYKLRARFLQYVFVRFLS